jgi:hypothetical protein
MFHALVGCKMNLPFFSFLAAVFYRASAFKASVSAWDIRVLSVIVNIFSGSGVVAQSLCGFYWMQSSLAQTTFPALPQIGIDKNGTICHCPAGTYYQKRIMPQIPYNPSQNPAPRLETCLFCGSRTYSPGGDSTKAVCDDCPSGFYCVTPASRERCTIGAYCPAKSTLPVRYYLDSSSSYLDSSSSSYYSRLLQNTYNSNESSFG